MKSALLSVSDKTGLIPLAKGLSEAGYRLLSTGGTAKAIKDAGIEVVEVSSITGFPECLDGRVKTLHPVVHAGILARRDLPEHMAQLKELGINTIDVVVINLYPFAATVAKPGVTLEEAIENIDIGGPTMLRAAAKNWRDVCVITDPADYEPLLESIRNGGATLEQKLNWSRKIYHHTAAYDAQISRWLDGYVGEDYPESLTLTFTKKQSLRYGENPHQTAAFYSEVPAVPASLTGAVQLHGKELSYNNINDTSAALEALAEFDEPCAVALKHAVPCGVGIGETIAEAFKKAWDADPVSIFGGIVALNRPVDLATAEMLGQIFLEVVVAPEYSEEAFDHLAKKKNIRLLTLGKMDKPAMQLKKVSGGLLVQSPDMDSAETYTVVTKRAPTEEEMKALKFGWKVVKHIRSNAIVLTGNDRTYGIGPGQCNRITALELAIGFAGENAKGSVMASDAFFPFDDCVEAAYKAGVTAIIQPGGSIKDQLSIDACDKYGIAMIFTGVRHFRH